MNCAKEARKLADYIISLGGTFQTYDVQSQFHYSHIGALYTDIILQAGLNYNSVVKPRVQKVLLDSPDANTVKRFKALIDQEGLGNVINWKDEVKLDRFKLLIDFSIDNEIDNCVDLKTYLLKTINQKTFLKLKGVGPKTMDYLMKLLCFDTVAVDRHIYSFVQMAEINVEGYHVTKRVVEYAADFLQLSRTTVDYGIWKYMSDKKYRSVQLDNQIEINFTENENC